jgi:hypothetical protein
MIDWIVSGKDAALSKKQTLTCESELLLLLRRGFFYSTGTSVRKAIEVTAMGNCFVRLFDVSFDHHRVSRESISERLLIFAEQLSNASRLICQSFLCMIVKCRENEDTPVLSRARSE